MNFKLPLRVRHDGAIDDDSGALVVNATGIHPTEADALVALVNRIPELEARVAQLEAAPATVDDQQRALRACEAAMAKLGYAAGALLACLDYTKPDEFRANTARAERAALRAALGGIPAGASGKTPPKVPTPADTDRVAELEAALRAIDVQVGYTGSHNALRTTTEIRRIARKALG